MPGTFIVRPIEANLTHNTDIITKMNPYCAFVVGNTRIKGQVCKKGGKHPHWNDSVTLPVTTGEQKILVELMDKDKISHDDNIGSFTLDLAEVQATGQVSKWYPLFYKNKAAGEILLETVFQPEGGMGMGMQTGMATGMTGQYVEGQQYGAISGTQNQYYAQEQVLTQPAVVEEVVTTTTTTAQPIVQQDISVTNTSAHSHVWTEQRQVVEPHTFVKEVEVVETRPAMKEIEVMEPVKVIKDVQYTQAVPVTKQIEVVEPQVVVKEVEVIEPRLVTKTIQVVENVPVKRQVEVVEMRNAIQEVQTFEPQTFTKQVEVTEFQPALQTVTVTQPVTVKKAVEYVEPVITTQYITKAVQEPVIIDQQITTEVGPASVIGMSEYAYYTSELSLAERQRITGLQRWVGYETIFTGLNDQERLWEQMRLSRLNEEEWLRERERLMGFNQEQRVTHQRGFFSKITQAIKNMGNHGGSTHSHAGEPFAQTHTHSSQYHPSPNF